MLQPYSTKGLLSSRTPPVFSSSISLSLPLPSSRAPRGGPHLSTLHSLSLSISHGRHHLELRRRLRLLHPHAAPCILAHVRFEGGGHGGQGLDLGPSSMVAVDPAPSSPASADPVPSSPVAADPEPSSRAAADRSPPLQRLWNRPLHLGSDGSDALLPGSRGSRALPDGRGSDPHLPDGY